MVAGLAETVRRELADELDVGLICSAGVVLVNALVRVALIRLRVLLRPGANLIFINEHLAILEPARELVQRLRVVVFADARIQPIVPVVHAADQVVAVDEAVGHQGAAMRAPPVQH